MDDAFALLRLQVEWGADEAVDLDPIDRLRPVGSKPIPLARSAAAAHALDPAKSEPTGTLTGTNGERALALAAKATTLDELRDAVASFDGCALRDTASHLVFAEGSSVSPILIIGEPPGREEDRSGHPFAGPEGQLLDQMLDAVGLNRGELMLTPLLPWRPPGGRLPSSGEIALCLPFLHRLIALLRPRRIVIFGPIATRILLPAAQARRHGRRAWTDARIPGMQQALPVLVLPALLELLKNPSLRREAWAGVRLLRRALDET